MMLPWNFEDCWAARPQLFFSCVQRRPQDGRMPTNGCHKTGPDDIKYDLVFFSTFEELLVHAIQVGEMSQAKTPDDEWMDELAVIAADHASDCLSHARSGSGSA